MKCSSGVKALLAGLLLNYRRLNMSEEGVCFVVLQFDFTAALILASQQIELVTECFNTSCKKYSDALHFCVAKLGSVCANSCHFLPPPPPQEKKKEKKASL